jgi:hypothetical protein
MRCNRGGGRDRNLDRGVVDGWCFFRTRVNSGFVAGSPLPLHPHPSLNSATAHLSAMVGVR